MPALPETSTIVALALALGAFALLLHRLLRTQRRATLAKRALERSEHEYRLLFEQNPNPMWVFDRDTLRFLAVNDAAVVHYGYSRDEFLALSVLDIRPSEDVAGLVAQLAAPSRPGTSPWRHRRRDGTLIDVEISTTDLDFRGSRARVVLAKDV